jgi:hypothetical protein
MHQVLIADLAWLTTFPHRVMPQDDEWLPGLLLRCDEVNHWESGTTLAHLRRTSSRAPMSGQPSWIVVALPALECLSSLLAVALSQLLTTTYQAELARLYAPASPHPAQLRSSGAFQLCPVCIAQRRLLRRISVLPQIRCCPTHQVIYLETCQCGMKLHPFARQSSPFACPGCGLGWEQLPRVRAEPERLTAEGRVLSCYELFFSQGTPELLAHAVLTVRDRLKRSKVHQVKLLDGRIKQVEHYELTKASLGYLVELLTSLGLPIPTS